MLLHTLRQRAAFQEVSHSVHRHHGLHMVVQCLFAPTCSQSTPHLGLGLVASRKVGGAVQRNRAKRRLRALVREMSPQLQEDRLSHLVIVARRSLPFAPYHEIKTDLYKAWRQFGLLAQETS